MNQGQKKKIRGLRCSSVVERLPSTLKTLGLIFSTQGESKSERGEGEQQHHPDGETEWTLLFLGSHVVFQDCTLGILFFKNVCPPTSSFSSGEQHCPLSPPCNGTLDLASAF